MLINVPTDLAIAAKDSFAAAELNSLVKDVQRMERFSSRDSSISLSINSLGEKGLSVLYDLSKEAGDRSLMMEITAYRKIINDPMSATVSNLKALPAGLVAFLLHGVIDGWVYEKHKDGTYLPWLVRDIRYREATQSSAAHVVVSLSANTASSGGRHSNSSEISTKSLHIGRDDIVKKTIPEILGALHIFQETAELKSAYEVDEKRFSEVIRCPGELFVGAGLVVTEGEYSSDRKALTLKPGTKLINDEGMVKRVINQNADRSFWQSQNIETGFDQQPYHCRLYMFHLELHVYVWAHVSNIELYQYRTDLREKLVLPESHRDLIEILATDMDVIMDDIIEGKSGGTTILCKGEPGLGKTLTAEVYAEVINKPLYRVHSGQLGVNAESVEKALKIILGRAERWRAVLLIDEADVFIRKRDNDIHHNAIVAAFLRTLEYFNGLLFMTTNRSFDIDDAILSRCIAIVNYEYPSTSDAKKIWRVLSDQFQLELSDTLLDELVLQFERLSGRDIKELLKLTSKFARKKGVPLNADMFRQCAMFRGV